eukprot:15868887-Heterocapsa_arctica.AAC.1
MPAVACGMLFRMPLRCTTCARSFRNTSSRKLRDWWMIGTPADSRWWPMSGRSQPRMMRPMSCEPRKPRRPRCMAASYGVIPSLERAQETSLRRTLRRPGMMSIFS